MPPCTANFCNGAPFSEVLAYPAYADGVRKTKLLIFFENLIFNLAIPLEKKNGQELGDMSKVTQEGWDKPGMN